MENKRSKGITFWGWYFIIIGILGLLGAVVSMVSPSLQPFKLGIGDEIYALIVRGAQLICGIFILRLVRKSTNDSNNS